MQTRPEACEAVSTGVSTGHGVPPGRTRSPALPQSPHLPRLPGTSLFLPPQRASRLLSLSLSPLSKATCVSLLEQCEEGPRCRAGPRHLGSRLRLANHFGF